MTWRTSDVAVCCSKDFGKVIGALAQLIQQARVLDGDHRLIGEGRNELYLLFSKWARLNAHEREDTDRSSLTQKRHAEDSSVPDLP